MKQTGRIFRKMEEVALVALLLLGSSVMAPQSEACTRVKYVGSDSLFVIGRSLDWRTPIPTNLYVYPAGIAKTGSDKPGAVSWTSRYGAVYAVGYDGGITEGMNEKGLVVNGLFCKGTVYVNDTTTGRPPMSLAMFVGWLLDMNATTDEVVETLRNQDFTIDGATFDGGTVSALHWGVTDASGKSIIFEFNNGNITIADMGDFRAMTNDPQWPQMTAIMEYWEKKGGTHTLPGTMASADRCVRANFFAHSVEPVSGFEEGMAIARSVLVTSSVPFTYTVKGEPNLSSTQWRSYADVRDCIYGFEMVTQPGYYWVDLKKCDLKPGAKVLKLDTSKASGLCGDVTKHFKKSEPFVPMY
ncbi:MAG: linear amide C-N hydrolase [Clostridium sp.]|nr:linear amide C-N hydrolase [Prevotella sp.]MCM1378117.1 linear amide C-N hydrolase [Prevotella sp.]MCM1428949.1 linear amide C-N hydrolase [Clostridium sp.]MCM1475983.1 linear amide C-N hydrolase [Muribaculaceae bacterium]